MRKLIVVTGGSKSIGRATIEKFMANGFDAVTCARTLDHLHQLRDSLQPRYPEGALHVHHADLSKTGDVKSFCQFVADLKRPVDVLVNNAGYFIPGKIVSEPDEGTRRSS